MLRNFFILLVVIVVFLQVLFLLQLATIAPTEPKAVVENIQLPNQFKPEAVEVKYIQRAIPNDEAIKPINDLTNQLNQLFEQLDGLNANKDQSKGELKLPTLSPSPIPETIKKPNINANNDLERKALAELLNKQNNEKPQEGSVEIGFKAKENFENVTFTGKSASQNEKKITKN